MAIRIIPAEEVSSKRNRHERRCELCGEFTSSPAIFDHRYIVMYVHQDCLDLAVERGSEYVRERARRPICRICWKPGGDAMEGSFYHYSCYTKYS